VTEWLNDHPSGSTGIDQKEVVMEWKTDEIDGTVLPSAQPYISAVVIGAILTIIGIVIYRNSGNTYRACPTASYLQQLGGGAPISCSQYVAYMWVGGLMALVGIATFLMGICRVFGGRK
jgi:hypothetical protein